MSASRSVSDPQRRRWRLRGQVQGVGFRPFVYRLAVAHALTGFVRNDVAGLTIEAQGDPAQLDQFAEALSTQQPDLAVVQQRCCEIVPVVAEATEFIIADSMAAADTAVDVAVDTAVCPDCLREMFDRSDRRYGYALTNCTNCGPRYSIVRRVPYDRPNTTMADFTMCPRCQAEYADPADRRFHAQPIACPACGPQVRLVDPAGAEIPGVPIDLAVRLLIEGKVVAVKGLGGFHLAVRADDARTVARLRRMKQRDHKPFAVMAADLDAARQLVQLSAQAVDLLRSPICPIVLAARLPGAPVAQAVAPESHRLGVMLPYTPLQHLLFNRAGEKLRYLVMTSGNQNDEPMAIGDEEALARLGAGGLCDALLLHDRPIERCVDDSVLLDVTDGAPIPLRRSRGYVPLSLPLPGIVPGAGALPGAGVGLCVGGELKNTVAVVRHGRAILSQHIGDLKHPQAFASFQRTCADLCRLLAVQPQWIAHDLHPLYLSTEHAQTLAPRWGVPRIPIQHHHAHAAAVLAEHGETGPALALVCDGVGYGSDGTSWGGELLQASLSDFTRLAHLRPLRLPGGDAAAHDTRRCGLALLYQALGDDFANHPATARLAPDPEERQMLTRMIVRNIGCTASTGTGRYFDGIAALLGVCGHNHYEAQAAQRLETLAAAAPLATKSRGLYRLVDDGTMIALDLAPLVLTLLETAEPTQAAALFHDELAFAWEAVIVQAIARTAWRTVALSGGVFGNERLTRLLTQLLERRGLRVLRHRLVPPNDGGLALGQAAIAAAKWDKMRTRPEDRR